MKTICTGPSSLAQSSLVTALSSALGAAAATASFTQGEVPDNMKRFWRFLLNKSLPPLSLTQLLYTVFGLGDSGPHFLLLPRAQQLHAQQHAALWLVARHATSDVT